MNGKVKFYNRDKGFGFLEDEYGNSYFFHIKSCKELDQKVHHDLEGKSVQFELAENPIPEKGDHIASNVRFS